MRYQLTRPASSKPGVSNDVQHGLPKKMFQSTISGTDKMLKGTGTGLFLL